MNRVNPPTHLKIPEEFNKDPIIRKFFDDFLFNIFQLWKRSGGGSDFIDNIKTEKIDLSDVEQPDILDLVEDDFIETSIDYTTTGSQTVKCNDILDLTLNSNPNDRELVKIWSNKGKINILTNKTIQGETSAVIRRKGTVWDIEYKVDIDGWVII